MIEISYLKKSLSINDIENNCSINFEQSKLSVLLEIANFKLEKNLNEFVEKIENHKFGHFAWICTWYNLRLDDLEGLVLYYYIQEIALEIKVLYPDRTIRIKCNFPKYFKKCLYKKVELKNVEVATENSIVKKLKIAIAPLQILKKFKIKFKKPHINKDEIWFNSFYNINKNRFKKLLDFVKTDNRYFFNDSLSDNVNSSEMGNSLNFSYYSKFSDFFSKLYLSVKFKFYLKNFNQFNFLEQAVRCQPVFHFYGMMLKETWVERAIIKQKPKAIFFATANTYSPARLVSRLAYLHKIPFVVVACRPMFSKLRLEERACFADLKPFHNAQIADFFIVWDLFSKNTLVEQGIDCEKIYISQPSLSQKNIVLEIENGLLIMFTHETDLNDEIIEQLSLIKTFNKLKIYIRKHPLLLLNKNQLKKLNFLFNNISDCSNLALNQISFKNSISISINTTALVEACANGSGIIWLPFLNYRAVIFYPVMQILGKILNDSNEFTIFLAKMQDLDDRNLFLKNCQDSYKDHFIGVDNANVLFKKLNIS